MYYLIRAFDKGDMSGKSDNFREDRLDVAMQQVQSLIDTGLCRRVELCAVLHVHTDE